MIYEFENIPIRNFFACTNGKFENMFIDKVGKITQDVIEAFEVIKTKFDESLNDNRAKEMRMQYVRILKEKKKALLLDSLIFGLAIKDDDELIDILKSMGFRYDPNNKLASLKQLQGEVANITNKIKELTKELTKTDKSEANEYTFISAMEKFKGFQINLDTTVLPLFIAYFKEFKRELDTKKNGR